MLRPRRAAPRGLPFGVGAVIARVIVRVETVVHLPSVGQGTVVAIRIVRICPSIRLVYMDASISLHLVPASTRRCQHYRLK